MLTTLQNSDVEVDLANIDKSIIINSITLQDVKFFLESLGVSQIYLNEDKEYLVCPTICHNPLNEAQSMKLYWYQNHKIFRCYTECNESMSIFKLYQKFMDINYHSVSEEEAENYVKNCLKHIIFQQPQFISSDNLDLIKYQYTDNIPLLPEYSKDILSYFTHYYHPTWKRDGITDAAMDKFHIGFSIAQNKIIIPHFDLQGRLIGIRGRALNKDEIEKYGKYRPIQIGNTLYTHNLTFNLYGIYEHQNGIKVRKSAIIAEAEKSVLLDDGYYHDLSNCVACCGSKFNKYHISLLTNILGANEIVVALDKEYIDWKTDKAKQYRTKIENMCKPYLNQATFSYIWDYDNVLNEKILLLIRGKKYLNIYIRIE